MMGKKERFNGQFCFTEPIQPRSGSTASASLGVWHITHRGHKRNFLLRFEHGRHPAHLPLRPPAQRPGADPVAQNCPMAKQPEAIHTGGDIITMNDVQSSAEHNPGPLAHHCTTDSTFTCKPMICVRCLYG
jgi:hypothetical protein